MPDEMTSNGGSRPVPDPTVLTTEQSDRLRSEMYREAARVETLLRTELDAHIRRIEERFKGIEERRVEQKADLKEALDKATATVDTLDSKRQSDVDEIKDRLGEIEGKYVTRDSIEQRLSSIEFGASRGRPTAE